MAEAKELEAIEAEKAQHLQG